MFSNLWSLTINKIKVIGNTHTKTETILAFVPELREKNEYTEEELKAIALRGKERLNLTGWFYKADIYIAPSKEGDDYKNIIIEVEEGFLYRFGGGPIYGMYGMDNVFGSGEYYSAQLGWNAQYIEAGSLFLTKNLFFKAGIGNLPGGYYSNNGAQYQWTALQNIGGELEAGYRINYDFSLSLLNNINMLYTEDYSSLVNYYSAGAKAQIDARSDLYSSSRGHFMELKYSAVIPLNTGLKPFSRIELDVRKYFSIIPVYNKLILALKFGAGYQDDVSQPDYLKLPLAGIDGIRNLNIPDLNGNVIVDGKAELRWDFFETEFFGIFNTDFEVMSFFDSGEAVNDFNGLSGDRLQFAFGLGLRVFFEAPVYIPLRLEIGWDKNGNNSLFFSMSAPF